MKIESSMTSSTSAFEKYSYYTDNCSTLIGYHQYNLKNIKVGSLVSDLTTDYEYTTRPGSAYQVSYEFKNIVSKGKTTDALSFLNTLVGVTHSLNVEKVTPNSGSRKNLWAIRTDNRSGMSLFYSGASSSSTYPTDWTDNDGIHFRDDYTCTGKSSGSGPTIGSVTLEEATYLSSCNAYTDSITGDNDSRKIQLEFKNSTEAQYTSYAWGNSSCTGTARSSYIICMNAITISSTVVSKSLGNGSGNALGFNATAGWKHNTDPQYIQFSADNASGFRFNQSETESGRSSNSIWYFTFTKQ
jgi:hypothetical protein